MPKGFDALKALMARSDRTKGFFVSFDYTRDALTEIDAFFRKSGRVTIPLTVQEIRRLPGSAEWYGVQRGEQEREFRLPPSAFRILASDFWLLRADMPEVGIEPTRDVSLSGF